MKNLIVLAALAFATPVFANTVEMGMVLGTSMQDVKLQLVEMGYEVRKSEMENGAIEVYFVKGNQRGEVYVSTQTGKVTRLKIK